MIEKPQSQKKFSSGDPIIRQGDQGDCAYIIESGKVSIHIRHNDGTQIYVGTRGSGAVIGEMALVDKSPRTATVTADEDCVLLEISREEYERRLQSADPIIKTITQVISTRYRDLITRSHIQSNPNIGPTAEAVEQGYIEQNNIVEVIKTEREFKNAIENDELRLYYQPIIDLKTKAIVGLEALMRWIHPEKGLISPAVFIPIAEESGLIVQASKWALREACQALKRIEAATGREEELYMSVNFSSNDFAEDDFLDTLYTIISETDVSPKQIQLEITESLLMIQPENAKRTLEMVQKAGLKVAIDDFGTGYSSLSYLHYFPINTLKIDQCFVRGMMSQTTNLELVKSIIALGKNLGMSIIAEGIEEPEQSDKLLELDCDMAQGFLFARPLPEKDLHELMINWMPHKD